MENPEARTRTRSSAINRNTLSSQKTVLNALNNSALYNLCQHLESGAGKQFIEKIINIINGKIKDTETIPQIISQLFLDIPLQGFPNSLQEKIKNFPQQLENITTQDINEWFLNVYKEFLSYADSNIENIRNQIIRLLNEKKIKNSILVPPISDVHIIKSLCRGFIENIKKVIHNNRYANFLKEVLQDSISDKDQLYKNYTERNQFLIFFYEHLLQEIQESFNNNDPYNPEIEINSLITKSQKATHTSAKIQYISSDKNQYVSTYFHNKGHPLSEKDDFIEFFKGHFEQCPLLVVDKIPPMLIANKLYVHKISCDEWGYTVVTKGKRNDGFLNKENLADKDFQLITALFNKPQPWAILYEYEAKAIRNLYSLILKNRHCFSTDKTTGIKALETIKNFFSSSSKDESVAIETVTGIGSRMFSEMSSYALPEIFLNIIKDFPQNIESLEFKTVSLWFKKVLHCIQNYVDACFPSAIEIMQIAKDRENDLYNLLLSSVYGVANEIITDIITSESQYKHKMETIDANMKNKENIIKDYQSRHAFLHVFYFDLIGSIQTLFYHGDTKIMRNGRIDLTKITEPILNNCIKTASEKAIKTPGCIDDEELEKLENRNSSANSLLVTKKEKFDNSREIELDEISPPISQYWAEERPKNPIDVKEEKAKQAEEETKRIQKELSEAGMNFF